MGQDWNGMRCLKEQEGKVSRAKTTNTVCQKINKKSRLSNSFQNYELISIIMLIIMLISAPRQKPHPI